MVSQELYNVWTLLQPMMWQYMCIYALRNLCWGVGEHSESTLAFHNRLSDDHAYAVACVSISRQLIGAITFVARYVISGHVYPCIPIHTLEKAVLQSYQEHLGMRVYTCIPACFYTS